ncbi:MAG: hydrolase [Gammaproteobacteria bacterium]|nr:hydrolase [Gammaproteobacteria bacterium]
MNRGSFRPAWWLPSPHLQTLWPSFFRTRLALEGRWERVELADGDFIDLVWYRQGDRPLVLVIHGLEGSLRSHYVTPTLAALDRHGFDTVFMHLRGCSGEPNRLARGYHSGATEDLAEVLGHLDSHGRRPAAAVGFSLGGNLLLKYLGEEGEGALLRAAVAVSVPFRLWRAAARLEQGASRLYGRHLLVGLKRSYRRKAAVVEMPFTVDLHRLTTLYEFDDAITAPLHGFAGADDYYHRCSSCHFIPRVVIPTRIIHALDDPFMYPEDVPGEKDLGPGVGLELARHGGHVGFVTGSASGAARYWLDAAIPRAVTDLLAAGGNEPFRSG